MLFNNQDYKKRRCVKIKYKFLLFVVLSFILVVFLNGCGKSECKVSSDCGQEACFTFSCEDKQCVPTKVPNCCGNNIKDDIENGKPGNECTCPQDYGKCEGTVQKQVGRRAVDAQYLEYLCQNDECTIGIDPGEILSKTLLDERSLNFFALETTTTYNGPFDVTKDFFRFRLTLKDSNENIVFPITFTNIKLTDGEELFGEKQLELTLEEVGDSFIFEIPISHQLKEPEEERRLTYQIDYEHNVKVRDQKLPDGSYSYKDELTRDEYKHRFSTKMTFVRTGIAK